MSDQEARLAASAFGNLLRLGNYRDAPAWGGRPGRVGAEASPGPVPKSGVVALRNQSRHRGCFFSHLLRLPAIVRRASGQGERRPELGMRWDRRAERRNPESRETWAAHLLPPTELTGPRSGSPGTAGPTDLGQPGQAVASSWVIALAASRRS